MKQMYVYMFAMISILLTTPEHAYSQVCTSVGPTSLIDSNVESVNLSGDGGSAINYIGCPAQAGLEDLTATQTVAVTAGNPYSASIQFGDCDAGFYYAGVGEAWIDWNQNDVFDPSESIGTWSGLPPVAASSFGFTVPLTAVTGITRMRVMQWENGTLPLVVFRHRFAKFSNGFPRILQDMSIFHQISTRLENVLPGRMLRLLTWRKGNGW